MSSRSWPDAPASPVVSTLTSVVVPATMSRKYDLRDAVVVLAGHCQRGQVRSLCSERDEAAVGAERNAVGIRVPSDLPSMLTLTRGGRAGDQVALEDIVLTRVIEGDPGHQIRRVADEADLVAVGAEDGLSRTGVSTARPVGRNAQQRRRARGQVAQVQLLDAKEIGEAGHQVTGSAREDDVPAVGADDRGVSAIDPRRHAVDADADQRDRTGSAVVNKGIRLRRRSRWAPGCRRCSRRRRAGRRR